MKLSVAYAGEFLPLYFQEEKTWYDYDVCLLIEI